MKLKPPRVTIQNTDSNQWLVCLEHTWSEEEHLACQVLVRKTDAPIGHIDRLAMEALRAHIDRMLGAHPA